METRARAVPEELKTIPIFTATKSLDVKYVFNYGAHENAFVIVPAAHTHAVLYTGYEGLLATRDAMVTAKGKQAYTTSINSVNFATAAITLLHTDTSPDEGYLGEDINLDTFYVSVEEKKQSILSSIDFYTKTVNQVGVTSSKAGRDATFNTLLTQRIAAFSAVSARYDLPLGIVSSPAGLDESIKGPMFHETFHHSEQALMHWLSSMIGIQYLLKKVQDTKAMYLYGMALDIFSLRMLCHNCNGSLLGLQNSHEAGFLNDFSQTLTRNRVQPRAGNNLMLSVRASAKQVARKSVTLDILRLPNDGDVVHEYHPERLAQVFQAENKALGTKKIIDGEKLTFSSFPGTFFVSSSFSKDKLESLVRATRELKIRR